MVGAKTDGIEKAGTNFTLTLTGEPVGKDFAKYEEVGLTLDELLLKHTSWVASGGRQGTQLDLTGMDMRKGPPLTNKKLTAMKARQATFAEMDMRGIEIQSAQLEKSDFRKCLLQSADMRGSNFREAIFQRADLSNANLNPLTFKKPDGVEFNISCNFENASLRQAVLAGARIMEGKFKGADLTEADFSNCDLRNADFTGANITGAKFDGAATEGAVFDKK
jgi:uncharacterized protein YjbI with pentapeptide repeats